jgi:hypothetical protein
MMNVRIRETAGTSWRDPRHPGTRHWRSTSVSYGAGWGLLGFLVVAPFWLLWWMLLLELWLSAECVLITVTGIAVLAVLVLRQARPGDVTLTRLRWGLVMVDLKGGKR